MYPREKEFGVRVCCKENQKFYLGEIGGGRVGAIYAINIPPCDPEHTVIAIVHSHGDQALSLSETDIRLSKHGYLAEEKRPISIPKNTLIASVATRNKKMAIQLYNPITYKYYTYKNGFWYNSNDTRNKGLNDGMSNYEMTED